MPIDAYETNPALRPTMLIHEIMKTVYRPGSVDAPPARPDATDNRIARATPRAA